MSADYIFFKAHNGSGEVESEFGTSIVMSWSANTKTSHWLYQSRSTATIEYATSAVKRTIKAMCQNKLVTCTDREPAMISIKNRVQEMLPDRATKGSKLAMNDQGRTLKLDLEKLAAE